MKNTNNLNNLEKRLGVAFKNQILLAQALTHRSFLNETDGKVLSNERLEFLGDAVISFVISSWLYKKFPHYPEGHLTNIRSGLVKTESLAIVAKKIEIGSFLSLSRGERKSGGEKNPSLLANTFEAIVGAICLDQGIEAANKIVRRNLLSLLKKIIKSGEFKGFKSLLQEEMQAKKRFSPDYRTIKEEGPDHAKTFTIGVYAQGKLITTGVGRSKKEAEESAAKAALEKLKPKA